MCSQDCKRKEEHIVDKELFLNNSFILPGLRSVMSFIQAFFQKVLVCNALLCFRPSEKRSLCSLCVLPLVPCVLSALCGQSFGSLSYSG